MHHLDLDEIRAELRQSQAKRDRLLVERENLEARRENGDDAAGVLERIERVNAGITNADQRVHDLEAEVGRRAERHRHLERLAQDPRAREEPQGYQEAARRAGRSNDAGLRTLERYVQSGELRSDAADRLDAVVRLADPSGSTGRYLEAVGNPDYFSAFGKLLADPAMGHLRHTPAEQKAMQAVELAQAESRAMSVGTGSAGGFAVPFTLDPTIINTSNGALNPVRQLARVLTIGTGTWKGVSADGVSVGYVAEATEATDASPTLAQPSIKAEQWRAFVPFSIEVGQDWSTLTDELLQLIADGRDVNDATAFLTGSGTNAPTGVLTGLSTSQRVETATTATYAVADPWTLKAAIPARFIGNTAFAAAPATWDTTYRFVGTDSSEPEQFDSGRGGGFLGRPKVEWSTMDTGSTTGKKIIVAGDFRAAYTIVDRIGITAELIPHLFGANQRPTGQRGLYVYGRTGAGVVAANALRYLSVK